MRNGKKVPHFFPNTVPAPEAELLGASGSSPVLQEPDGCRFTQIPSGRKTASFFCPNHRRTPRRRITACVFLLSLHALSPPPAKHPSPEQAELALVRKSPAGQALQLP
ncbi:hypothetical protein CXT97_02920 [Akkermansia muciniphila]|nr:hypothetical protein CXT97_02920 [Akkermansia muciniphila]PNC98115.1 hypothetical protein CXT90_09985 [Akkermansia muciniphila]